MEQRATDKGDAFDRTNSCFKRVKKGRTGRAVKISTLRELPSAQALATTTNNSNTLLHHHCANFQETHYYSRLVQSGQVPFALSLKSINCMSMLFFNHGKDMLMACSALNNPLQVLLQTSLSPLVSAECPCHLSQIRCISKELYIYHISV